MLEQLATTLCAATVTAPRTKQATHFTPSSTPRESIFSNCARGAQQGGAGLKQQRQEFREKLKNMSYRCINDGFEFIIWACMERGVHGALLSELLHAIQIGMHDRAIESLFGVAGKKAPGKKKPKP